MATAPLNPVATATSVQVHDSKSLVTDGLFAETREQLGGFFLINTQDLDEAIGAIWYFIHHYNASLPV